MIAIFRAKLYLDLQPIFHDFLSVIAALKLKSDVIPEKFTDRKDELASRLNELMNFDCASTRLSADELRPNPGLRNSAKAKKSSKPLKTLSVSCRK